MVGNYTNIFGGTAVKAAQPSFLALTFTFTPATSFGSHSW